MNYVCRFISTILWSPIHSQKSYFSSHHTNFLFATQVSCTQIIFSQKYNQYQKVLKIIRKNEILRLNSPRGLSYSPIFLRAKCKPTLFLFLNLNYLQHELHLSIYYASNLLNTFEIIIAINSNDSVKNGHQI